MNRFELLEKMIANVHAMSRYMAPHKERLYASCPYTGPQMTLLATIFEAQSISSSDLAQKMNITPGAITQMIEPLFAHGLVTKSKDAADQRVTHISLTKKGIESYNKERTQYIENMLPIFDSLSDTELETLVTLHEKVVHNLSQHKYEKNSNDTK